jgi:hypothetical protein
MLNSRPGTRQQASCPVVVAGGNVAGLGFVRSLAAARTCVVVLDTSLSTDIGGAPIRFRD